MHVGVDKTYWNNSCWLVGIVFTLKKQGVDNVTMSERMHEMSGKKSSGLTKMHVLLGEILGWVTSRDFS